MGRSDNAPGAGGEHRRNAGNRGSRGQNSFGHNSYRAGHKKAAASPRPPCC